MNLITKIANKLVDKKVCKLLDEALSDHTTIQVYDGFPGKSTEVKLNINNSGFYTFIRVYQKELISELSRYIVNNTEYNTAQKFMASLKKDDYFSNLMESSYQSFFDEGNTSYTISPYEEASEKMNFAMRYLNGDSEDDTITEEEYLAMSKNAVLQEVMRHLSFSETNLVSGIILYHQLKINNLTNIVNYKKVALNTLAYLSNRKSFNSDELVERVLHETMSRAKEFAKKEHVNRTYNYDLVYSPAVEKASRLTEKYVNIFHWVSLILVYVAICLLLPGKPFVAWGVCLIVCILMTTVNQKLRHAIRYTYDSINPDTGFCMREYRYLTDKLADVELNNMMEQLEIDLH